MSPPARLPLLAAVLLIGLAVPLGPLASAVEAQPAAAADTLVEVRLTDGSTLIGRIVSETADRIVIETSAGVRVEVDRARIRSIRPVRGRMVDGRLWPEDPNTSRLFFGPTGRTIEQGEGYVAAYMLFLPFVGYGATDWLTLSGGTPILPEAIGRIWYLAPKARLFTGPNVDLSVGTIAFFSTAGDWDGTAGLLYGVGTFGHPDAAFSVGPGWGFSWDRDQRSIDSSPVIMAGGEYRVGPTVKLISENYFAFFEGFSGSLLTGGVRFFGERLSADLGVGLAAGNGNATCCLPIVNFVYNFGDRD